MIHDVYSNVVFIKGQVLNLEILLRDLGWSKEFNLFMTFYLYVVFIIQIYIK